MIRYARYGLEPGIEVTPLRIVHLTPALARSLTSQAVRRSAGFRAGMRYFRSDDTPKTSYCTIAFLFLEVIEMK